MFNNAYLIIGNRVVGGDRAVDIGITQAAFEALEEKERNKIIEEAAWEYAEAYAEQRGDHVVVVVSLGYHGCDAEVDTDVETEEEWDELDTEVQEQTIREAFWEAVDCFVVFEPNDKEAEKHCAWGGKK